MISMDDEKAKAMAGVLGNKTCKKIIDRLAEKEASEKDLADFLKLPMNTVEYNLKKLLEAGLIDKTKNFFWSKKGKKIDLYKLSNKSIIISPRSQATASKIKSLAIVTALSGFAALLIGKLNQIPKTNQDMFLAQRGAEEIAAAPVASTVQATSLLSQIPIWLWFLIGSLFAIIILIILNWRKDK